MNARCVERPISGEGRWDGADRCYCARNREACLHAAYAAAPIKAWRACNTSGLDANEAFAHRHGLSGTPVIVRSDGAVLEGYRPRAFLEKWLKERSEEHTSELQSLMRISYAVFCLKKKKKNKNTGESIKYKGTHEKEKQYDKNETHRTSQTKQKG